MSIGEFVKGVVTDVLEDMLKKATTSKRRRRRKTATSTANQTLRQIEKLLKPAKRQTSRKKTVRARSKARRASSLS